MNPMPTITVRQLPLGALLQKYRQLSDIDQTAMGAHMGVTRQTISLWESGRREPNFSQVVAWARITDQPIEPLIEAVENESVELVMKRSSVRFRQAALSSPRQLSLDGGFLRGIDAEYEALCIVEAVAL